MIRIAAEHDRFGFIVRLMLLIAGLCTHFVDPDDVAWRFVKASPRAHLLEHICFGIVAGVLGLSLGLEVKSGAQAQRSGLTSSASLNRTSVLQAIGIGSLMPLPGFLLLVSGESVVKPAALPARRASGQASRCDERRTISYQSESG